jgi:hypothetical protein
VYCFRYRFIGSPFNIFLLNRLYLPLVAMTGVFICAVIEAIALAGLAGLHVAEIGGISTTKWFGAVNFFLAGVIIFVLTLALQKLKILCF